MDPNTLTLYLVAGGLNIALSAVLLALAYLQRRTRLLKSSAVAILMLSVGLAVSGFGPSLPRWVTVMGTNMLMIAAGAVTYSGFAAFFQQRKAEPDRVGWLLTALTALPFWYWGLIEPDGNYRTAVFSFAVALVNVRTAVILVRTALQHPRSVPIWALAIQLGILSFWMAARGVLALAAQAPAASVRGLNPTTWTTVFWYIVLISLISICLVWMEFSRPAINRQDAADAQPHPIFSVVQYFRNKLLLLWAAVLILMLAFAGETALFYAKSFEWEEARLTRGAELSNDASVQHSMQVINSVQTILYSVRNFYLSTRSTSKTEGFIDSLPFDKSAIDNVYLIDPQGMIVVSHKPAAEPVNVADRDYFRFLQSTAGNQFFIGSVEWGRVTGKYHFRIALRVSNADGSFAGVVLASVNPESFSRFYQRLAGESQNLASLLGTSDRKLRARMPEPAADQWQVPLLSPLWDALQQSPSGSYRHTSPFDHMPRVFVYRAVGDLPLVMVTAFSESDLRAGVGERIRWLAVVAFTVAVTVLLLASLLTIEIRRRNEQDRFMSMLSHELKTPLSVLRMAVGLRAALSPHARRHAQQSVQDMDVIVERCLQVDRMWQRRHIAVQQACQLGDILAQLQIAGSEAERVQINLPDLPDFSTDTQLLRMVLGNLVDNALKYSPPGSAVQINASSQPHRGRPGILVSVHNAPGKAGWPDARQVFRKYYRSPGAHHKTGSGLGLYLVRSLTRQLGGWVRYAPSTAEVRFEFWLPT